MRPTLRRGLGALLVCAAMVCAALLPVSAEVRVEPDGLRGARHNIVISGPIDLFTLYAFVQVIADPRISATSAPVVELNSPGGSVNVAMAIGHLIRKRGFATGVDKRQECHSACVLILAAGVQRIVGSSRVGIHRPHMGMALLSTLSREQTKETYDQIGESMRLYLESMGMSDHFFPAMLKVPSDRIRVLSRPEMHAFGLVEKEPVPSTRVAMEDRHPQISSQQDSMPRKPSGMGRPAVARKLSSSRRSTRGVAVAPPEQRTGRPQRSVVPKSVKGRHRAIAEAAVVRTHRAGASSRSRAHFMR